MRFTSTYFGTAARPFLDCRKSYPSEATSTPPNGSRFLDVGETIRDGDLYWNATLRLWMAVISHGEERVEPSQHGFYCRKNGPLPASDDCLRGAAVLQF